MSGALLFLSARLSVAIDIAVRVAVIVVGCLLIDEFWDERIGPEGDGFPVTMLIGPIAAYVIWNGWRIVRQIRVWRTASLDDSSFLAEIALLAGLRLVWLLPLTDRLWWPRWDLRMPLIVATTVGALLAYIASIALRQIERGQSAPSGGGR